MTLEEAADICHSPFRIGLQHATHDHTADAAEVACGAEARRVSLQEERALKNEQCSLDHARGYGLAVHDLEAVTCNLRAYSRGMVAREVLPGYIAQAREALDKIEGTLS